MHRLILLRNVKKNNSYSFGQPSLWFHLSKCTWFHNSSQKNQVNFSTHTGTTALPSASHFRCLPMQELALGYKPRVAGRPYLPGSSSGGFPEFVPGPQEGRPFPMAYEVKKPEQFNIKAWSSVCRELVDAKLAVHGAILFRNLPLCNTEDFKSFVQSLGFKFFNHGTAGHRTPLGENVYTASDEPPEFTIEPHNECSFSPFFPKKLIMFCQKEPDSFCGGETVLLKNQDLTALLDPEVTRKFEEKKIRYEAFLPNKHTEVSHLKKIKSWQDRFWEENPQAVDNVLESNGWNFSWDEDYNLRFWYHHSPSIPHPVTGKKIWFNQVTIHHESYSRALYFFDNRNIPDNQMPFQCYYGDGSDIEPAVLQHIRAAMWSRAVGFRWRTFDVAVLDNQQVLHGRMGWTGERKLVTSLIDE